jgi:hypothetical protein
MTLVHAQRSSPPKLNRLSSWARVRKAALLEGAVLAGIGLVLLVLGVALDVEPKVTITAGLAGLVAGIVRFIDVNARLTEGANSAQVALDSRTCQVLYAMWLAQAQGVRCSVETASEAATILQLGKSVTSEDVDKIAARAVSGDGEDTSDAEEVSALRHAYDAAVTSARDHALRRANRSGSAI